MKAKNILSIFVLSVLVVSLLAFVASAHVDDLPKHAKERLENAKNMIKDRISDVTKLEGLKEHQLRIIENLPKQFQEHAQLKDRLNTLDKDRFQKLMKMPPGIVKKLVESGDFGMLNNITLKQVAKADLKMAFHKRQVAANMVESAHKKLGQAKERFEKAKGEFKAKKADFLKSKNLTDAKAYLANVLDALVEQVNKLKERVQASEDLSAERVAEVLADLDSRLTKLNEWKTKVETATTGAELKAILIEIRTSLKSENSIMKAINVHGWRVVLQHFAGILKQVDHLDTKLNRLLTFAENNNVTVENKETRVADFQGKLADAKSHFQLAVGEFKKLKELKTPSAEPNVDTISVEIARKMRHTSITTHMKEAKAKLKEARTVLQSLVKEIVASLKGATTDEGEPVQITEEQVLDPTKVTEGIDIEEGETTVEIAEETALEL
ncbi:MAG: hypothetical protein HY512_01585 [Candidatus Aenigmarchaeota archaeon]|nr:hypothetical protein [Candidatus Aenigmarchaeota archaeon]